MLAAVPEFSSWAAVRFDATGWLWWSVASLGLAHGGACMRPWASGYALRLLQGAAPDAATLWGVAAKAVRCLRPARVDALWALAWGVAGGATLAVWGVAASPALALCLGLAVLAWIDVRSGLLPDALTLPLMVAGWCWGPLSVVAASSASALVWAGLAALAGGYRWLRGEEGFGGGDVKCLAALAAWLGVGGTASVLCQACLLGVGFWGWQHGRIRHALVRSRHPPTPAAAGLPFGPCIVLAAIPAILGVPALQSWF